MSKKTVYVESGLSFGTVIAALISWGVHHSIGWAIIHGLFSWLYILYSVFTGDVDIAQNYYFA